MAFVLRIAREVHDALELMSDDQRKEVLHIIHLLRADPTIDGLMKSVVPTQPPETGYRTFYGGRRVWVSYRYVDNQEIHVAACGTYSSDPDRPNLRL